MGLVTVNVASISWIDEGLMSRFRSMPLNVFKQDAWLDQLCYGMSHTANPTPPKTFDGRKYQAGSTLAKKYRSLTSFTVDINIGDKGVFQSTRRAQGSDPVLDGGYTPPFDSKWELYKGVALTSLVTIDPTVAGKMHSEATAYNEGEKSSLSEIVLPGTAWQPRGITPLAYSSIPVPRHEIILGHSFIKFRAGTRGDYIGVVAMGTPAHVPWVWCEAMLTYAAPNLVLYGAGSAFPCHAFYVNGKQLGRLDLTTDLSTLKTIFGSGLKATFTTVTTSAGPSTPPLTILTGINTQAPMQETAPPGKSVTGQSYTAPANATTVRAVVSLD
jgi:hypothetical protein